MATTAAAAATATQAAPPAPAPAPAEPAAPAPAQDEEAVFEAFATCDFAQALHLALSELGGSGAVSEEDGAAAAAAVSEDGAAAAPEGTVPLSLPGAPTCGAALTEACSRADKLAAVALQCGLELRQEEAGRAVGAHYLRTARGRVPFPVAMIWLQILLAQGDHEEVKRVLLALRLAIEGIQAKAAQEQQEQEEDDGEAPADEEEEEEDGSTEGSGATPQSSSSSPSPAPPATRTTHPPATDDHRGQHEPRLPPEPEEGELRSMYAQATELLILRVLIPRGEGPAAVELLAGQGKEAGGGGLSLLEAGHRQRLLEACRGDARRRAVLGSGGGVSHQQHKGGRQRRSGGATAAVGNGRHGAQQQQQQQQQQQLLAHRRPAPPSSATNTTLLSSGRLSPSALAAVRARSPSPGWGSSLLNTLLGPQRQGKARRWLMAVAGFCVLALGYHARQRGGRVGDGPLVRAVRAALAAVMGGGGAAAGAGRRMLSG